MFIDFVKRVDEDWAGVVAVRYNPLGHHLLRYAIPVAACNKKTDVSCLQQA
jgi:hypothetical protein